MAEYKVNYTQSNFTGGIIAAELYGRNDFNKVKSGLKQCTNWTIREAGGLEFRRGTKYVAKIPASAGADFKTASLGEEFFVFGDDGIHWLDGKEFKRLGYPVGHKPDLANLQFNELQRRLYFYDGAQKLCQITLNVVHMDDGSWHYEPEVSITLFDGELPEGNSIELKVEGKQPDPAVLIDYTYAFSVAKDVSHESVATISEVLKEVNAELGPGSEEEGNESQRIDITINLTEDVINSNKGGKVLIYKKYQGNFYYLDSLFLEDGKTEYNYSDQGQITPDVSKAIKTLPVYMNSDGSIGGGELGGVASIADYGQRIFMTLKGFGTNIIFSQVGNIDSMAFSELRNEDEAGYLEVPVSHFDSWCKVVSGLDLIFSTSYTISQIQGYGDLQLQTVLFDGFSKTVQPVTTRRSMIYTNSNNRNIYDLTYNEYGQYDGIDLTLLVKYIFETKKIKRLAFKDYPVKTIYVLCDDGDLYCLTYIKDQNIYAWYKINHYDKIHDILVINKAEEDEIYLSIETEQTQYGLSYDWHYGESQNKELYDSLSTEYNSLSMRFWGLTGGDDETSYFLRTSPDTAKVGDKLYSQYYLSGNRNLVETEKTIASIVIGSTVLGKIYTYYDSEGVSYAAQADSGGGLYWLPEKDKVGDIDIEYVSSGHGKKICLPDQADKVIQLYDSEDNTDYVILDEAHKRFWGQGYSDTTIPVRILEIAYNKDKSIYMDSTVSVSRSDIVENKITGLPAHMIGKKVRVFDLGNNQYHGDYDIQNPQSIVEGGNVVQIDDLDFNGYLVDETGSIQLESSIDITGDVLVGVPYYAVAETIPLEFSDNNGNSTIGRKKNITEAYLRYGDSRGVSYKTLGKEYKCNIPAKEISDTAEFLERGQMRLDVASEYKWDSTIKILQREPYPARIESITLGLHFNDKS